MPLPQHRHNIHDISIEFYYQDTDIVRKDDNGRRLFFSNEFNPKSGRHYKEDINCMDINKLKGQSVKIIDGQVYDSLSNSIALSKEDFANYIYRNDSNFSLVDILAFVKIFEVIVDIMKYPDESLSIPH